MLYFTMHMFCLVNELIVCRGYNLGNENIWMRGKYNVKVPVEEWTKHTAK